MNWKFSIFFSTILLFTLISCSSDAKKEVPNVEAIEVEVNLNRFEQELFQLDTMNLEASLNKLEAKYPEFSKLFFERILRSKDPRVAPEGHLAYMKGFLGHSTVRHLADTVNIVFPSLDEFIPDFEQAFKLFKYYFPDQQVPDITTFISEYTFAAFIYGDNSLAVGLDFFLGEDYPYAAYNPYNPNFSDYITRSFNKDHLVLKTVQPLVEDLVGIPQGNNLLDLMIHNGKKYYLYEKLLPFTPDSVKLEIRGEQVEWLQQNEFEMWAYLISEDLLYNDDHQKIRKFVEYSPHSPGMPPEAPGRTANWLGMKIVEQYMERHPELSIPDLLELTDAQQLLTASRYKPKRN